MDLDLTNALYGKYEFLYHQHHACFLKPEQDSLAKNDAIQLVKLYYK